jgi:hypothetical protein
MPSSIPDIIGVLTRLGATEEAIKFNNKNVILRE